MRTAWITSFAATIFILAALLALQSRSGGLVKNFTGGTTYRQIAENLATTGQYSTDGKYPTGYRPPLYPLVLSGIIRLTETNSQAVTFALHVALDLTCLALLLTLVQRISGSPRAILAAGLLFAFDCAFHHEALAQRETMLFVALLLTFCNLCARRRVELAALMAAAVVVGLAWLTRPSGIALIPLLCLVAFLAGPDKQWHQRLARLCTACFLLAAVILPWQAFLYRSFNAPILSGTTSGGLNIYQGNNPAADVLIPFVDVDAYKPVIDTRLDEAGIPPHEELARDRTLRAEAMTNIRNQPLTFARRAVIKTLALFSPVPTPLGSADLKINADRVELNNFKYTMTPWTILMTLHGCALLIGLTIAIIRRKQLLNREPVAVRVIFGYILLTTILHAITFAETRFRMPLDPLMIALAAAAIFPRSAIAQSTVTSPQP